MYKYIYIEIYIPIYIYIYIIYAQAAGMVVNDSSVQHCLLLEGIKKTSECKLE